MNKFKSTQEEENKTEADETGIDKTGVYGTGIVDDDAIKFITVARLVEAKGIQYAIEAFEKIHRDHPSVKYIVVGFGPYEQTLKDIVREKGLYSAVKFVNNLETPDPRGTVVDNMKNADVFLLPSFSVGGVAREGTPIVLMEAQACGLPCISTDFAGIPEIVLHEKTGYIVTPGDTLSLELRMRQLIGDPESRKVFALAAREHIEKEFNQEVQIERLVEIYREFI